ncbi:hypothetical protein Cgig2_003354 [Carnegiea gigantea]|uniref:Glycine-rich protein n=1 Tax=Carnegiea gigantea TaxID=171969 RepID=A0A9Q1K178_9CARY|nr:hypothetical protein Cgig2_003354 [Carnegiea gigantea]
MNSTKASTTTLLLLTLLLITELSTLSGAARPGPTPTGADGGDGLPFFGPGGGFGIPGFDTPWGQGITGGGYGYGYGSPEGGYARSGTIRPTVVCRDKGPCYMKKLTCPAKCFSSFSKSGKGYGAGGGGGGCTVDCKNKFGLKLWAVGSASMLFMLLDRFKL